MNITRASFSFAAAGHSPAGTLFIASDGYPDGAASRLREMLLNVGESSARAFEQATYNVRAEDPSGGLGTSFRYQLDGMQLVAEERVAAGVNKWSPVFAGPLLDFIQGHSTEPMLHATGLRADGGEGFTTLAQLESYLAEAQGEAIRYEAGVEVAGGETAAERVLELRAQVLAALRAELLAGRVEAGNYVPQLKTYTVIAEMWSNEQGYAATVQAVDDDAAAALVQQQYAQAVAAAKQGQGEEESETDEDDEDSESGLLRIWAVLEGNPDVIHLRDAA